jgi:hypothetical protein
MSRNGGLLPKAVLSLCLDELSVSSAGGNECTRTRSDCARAGVWGFSRCLGLNCPYEPEWTILHKSFNLIRGNGDFSFEKDPWQLVVAQDLVPGVALFAAAKFFLLNLRRDYSASAPFRSQCRARPLCPNQRTLSQAVETTASLPEAAVTRCSNTSMQKARLTRSPRRHARARLMVRQGRSPLRSQLYSICAVAREHLAGPLLHLQIDLQIANVSVAR